MGALIVYSVVIFIAIVVARAIFSIGTIVKNLELQNSLLKKQNDVIIQSISFSKISILKQVSKIQIQNKESGEFLVVGVAEWMEKYQFQDSKYKIINVD